MPDCEECGATAATMLLCGHCKAVYYCSKACQKRNWKRIHKRACPVEAAVEKVLAKLPPMEQAQKDAFCYICLDGEGDGKSSKLMRGCACRGNSAGFVHIECLAELAMSKEASRDTDAVSAVWSKCGNCKQKFTGALWLETRRRFWRRYRSSQDLELRYNSTKFLGFCLGDNGEYDAANQLLDDASTCVGNNPEALLDLRISRADMLADHGQKLEALRLLQAILPEAKESSTNPHLYGRALHEITNVLLRLDRNAEAHEMVTELVTFAKAHYGLEDPKNLIARSLYAVACAKLGRVEEAKVIFEEVITTQTRVFGRDHPHTQYTISLRQSRLIPAIRGPFDIPFSFPSLSGMYCIPLYFLLLRSFPLELHLSIISDLSGTYPRLHNAAHVACGVLFILTFLPASSYLSLSHWSTQY